KLMVRALVIAVVVAAGLGIGPATRTTANPPPERPKPGTPTAENPPHAPNESQVVRGRVLRPDGTPAAGAAIYLRERDLLGKRVKETKVATTGADGRFEATPSDWSAVVVVANGFAPEWANLGEKDGELTL